MVPLIAMGEHAVITAGTAAIALLMPIPTYFATKEWLIFKTVALLGGYSQATWI